MRIRNLIILCFIMAALKVTGQQYDSTYIEEYPQKMWATGYVSTNTFELSHKKMLLSPNYPINAGVGLGIRNTVINFLASSSIVPLKGNNYGKTKAIDLQLHSYGRKYLIDLSYQRYKGFFQQNGGIVSLYPELAVRQIGGEFTYLASGNRFSAKAAFEHSEKQLVSAGSLLLGIGGYWQRIEPDPKMELLQTAENLQLGLTGGYAYTWVIERNWQVCAMATLGTNVGNQTEALKQGEFKIYPSAAARTSATYQNEDWSLSFSMLINTKRVYTNLDGSIGLTSVGMQIAFVKQFDSFWRKQK